VLLEDLGALIGLVLALVGVTLAAATGEPRWDGAGTLSIGVLLVLIAVVLAAEMKSLLIGESATDEDQRAIRAAIEAGPPVRGLIHMRTLHLGPEELLVAAKIELDPGLSAAGFGAAIDTVEARIRAAVPIARVIYLEPDQRRPAGEPTPAAPPAASS
jgi:divalent metal cation (Fe/Co/Zn/Cd) transporter